MERISEEYREQKEERERGRKRKVVHKVKLSAVHTGDYTASPRKNKRKQAHE